MKFYKCDICGKIVAIVKDTEVDTDCCGQAMRELVPNETDGSAEKHVPVYRVNGNAVTVSVGAVAHPMSDEHHVEWIAIETENGNQYRHLKVGDRPQTSFALVPYDKIRNVYECCNLHGLWVG